MRQLSICGRCFRFEYTADGDDAPTVALPPSKPKVAAVKKSPKAPNSAKKENDNASNAPASGFNPLAAIAAAAAAAAASRESRAPAADKAEPAASRTPGRTPLDDKVRSALKARRSMIAGDAATPSPAAEALSEKKRRKSSLGASPFQPAAEAAAAPPAAMPAAPGTAGKPKALVPPPSLVAASPTFPVVVESADARTTIPSSLMAAIAARVPKASPKASPKLPTPQAPNSAPKASPRVSPAPRLIRPSPAKVAAAAAMPPPPPRARTPVIEGESKTPLSQPRSAKGSAKKAALEPIAVDDEEDRGVLVEEPNVQKLSVMSLPDNLSVRPVLSSAIKKAIAQRRRSSTGSAAVPTPKKAGFTEPTSAGTPQVVTPAEVGTPAIIEVSDAVLANVPSGLRSAFKKRRSSAGGGVEAPPSLPKSVSKGVSFEAMAFQTLAAGSPFADGTTISRLPALAFAPPNTPMGGLPLHTAMPVSIDALVGSLSKMPSLDVTDADGDTATLGFGDFMSGNTSGQKAPKPAKTSLGAPLGRSVKFESASALQTAGVSAAADADGVSGADEVSSERTRILLPLPTSPCPSSSPCPPPPPLMPPIYVIYLLQHTSPPPPLPTSSLAHHLPCPPPPLPTSSLAHLPHSHPP